MEQLWFHLLLPLQMGKMWPRGLPTATSTTGQAVRITNPDSSFQCYNCAKYSKHIILKLQSMLLAEEMLLKTIFHGFSSHVNIPFLVSKQGKHVRREYIFFLTGMAEYLLFTRPFFRNYFPREILLLLANIFTHSTTTYWAVTQIESRTWKAKEIWLCLSRCSQWCGSLVASRALFLHHAGGADSLLWEMGISE